MNRATLTETLFKLSARRAWPHISEAELHACWEGPHYKERKKIAHEDAEVVGTMLQQAMAPLLNALDNMLNERCNPMHCIDCITDETVAEARSVIAKATGGTT